MEGIKMEDKKIVGKETTSTTSCNLQPDGYWKVVSQIHDRVLYEGETEWIDEMVEAMSMDKDCETAIKTSMNSTLSYLLQNVYQNGFAGLVEYREYERKLNASKVESPQNS